MTTQTTVFPHRLTTRWVASYVGTIQTPDEWEALVDEMRSRGWGNGDNSDIEWFLWGLLPMAVRRQINAGG